jgi:predicted ribosome quality control (RQC) complex YloA/Tae2 family protein
VTDDRQPFAVYWTREEHQAALESYIGERLAKLQRAIRRAERERDELREEVEELRRAVHSGGTRL